MDSLTVSEILRLHLVSSGGRSSEIRTKWRYQQRGGYSSADDPGVQLRQEDAHILNTLTKSTVYELSIGDKMKIVKCLCHQILTYASIRDVLEEKSSRLTQLKQELRALHANERRMRKEDVINRAKLRTEENGNTEDGAELNKLLQEGAKRKADVLKKEQQLRHQVLKLQAMTHLTPLGQDRAFRRFWIFESCPGFFVENDDEFVGSCLPQPTPCTPLGPTPDSSKSKEDIRKFFKAANKENEDAVDKSTIFGICNADFKSCPVHATYIPRTKWSFYEDVESLDKLILSLNERGLRESLLRTTLLQEKERIVEGLHKCPIHRLDNTKPEVKLESETRKSQRQIRKEKEYDINLYFPPGTPVEQIMERTLIDMILETEEKIFVGGLGALKVKDRSSWRTAIEDGEYDSQVDAMTWGGKLELKTRIKSESTENVDEEECNRSEISSSLDGDGLVNSTSAKKNVVDITCSILQLAQSIESKYLKKPLGEDEKDKRRRLKAEEALKKWEDLKETGDNLKSEPKVVRTPLEKWELSLQSCTSFSQLYVHLALLDNSITWNRSALNARCRICRRKGDAEKMLLCDGCDKGHHMYCLKPPLTVVPEGDWFCTMCKPREKPRTPRKARRVFSELSDDEDQSGEEESGEVGEEEAEGEAGEGEEAESEVESIHNETCPVCQEGGEVICCDTCPAVYHLECINPPLRKVPRGKWSCPQCKSPSQDKDRGKLKEKNSDGRNSTRLSRTRQVLDFDEEDKEVVMKRPPVASRKRTQTEPVRAKSPPPLGPKRRSAAEPVDKIATSHSTKRLKTDHYEDDANWNGARRRTRPLPLPSASSDSGVVDIADLNQLLTDLNKHPDSWPFHQPVTRAEAPDYHQVIKQPMDLGTIKYKLNTIQYKNSEEFIEDLQLIFTNCYTYNNEDADEYKCGRNLSQNAERQLRKLGLNVSMDK